ncbi:hypothetical protein GCM10018793_70980 [Streptomyces sulfonofaciens]|uniref:Uncharacterized protein n=2 Tax=Streptomyces sulfonofaciens TaxID=68272 RepID=A0A919GRR7_9ACTN|nr:hypothetical protein GCM10018793_70980 [Streptomyces sulfonofaciens]
MPEAMTELPHVREVEPFSEKDQPCFEEVREVLKKHGALSRFGLTLLHQHFDMADNEVLLETTDVENRVQTLTVKKKSDLDSVLETAWRLDSHEILTGCRIVCVQGEEGCLSDSC